MSGERRGTVMRMVWIGGWGIAAQQIEAVARRRWPETEHAAIAPGRTWLEQASRLVGPQDRIVGYSLGAFLLLRTPHSLGPPELKTLAAPIVDLRLERQLGGRVEEGRIRYMVRQLARNPLATVADFYRSAGLQLDPPAELPYDLEDLAWGLEQLLRPPGELPPPAALRGAAAVVGDCDPLLDAGQLAGHVPGLRILRGVGHGLESLLDGLT